MTDTITTVLESQKMVSDVLFPDWKEMLGEREEEVREEVAKEHALGERI